MISDKPMLDEYPDRDLAIEEGRRQNLVRPAVPNRTKVVRLFVVPPGKDPAEIIRTKSPTRADVFVVTGDDGNLKPMSWLGDGLVEHDRAHDQHVESVVVLMGIDREQIEWQCDVPFAVSRIQRIDESEHGFPKGSGPEQPFEVDPTGRTGDRCEPIRSGPTKVRPDGAAGPAVPWNQLYKAHFVLWIGGQLKPLDPDFYCDWR